MLTQGRATSGITKDIGAARRKLPAVTCVRSPAVRPGKEYTLQAMPAAIISRAPVCGGAVSPGSGSATSPPDATSTPATCTGRKRSLRASAAPTIVTCTAPKSSSAPVAAVRLRYAKENAAV